MKEYWYISYSSGNNPVVSRVIDYSPAEWLLEQKPRTYNTLVYTLSLNKTQYEVLLDRWNWTPKLSVNKEWIKR